jgi:5-methylcytosine-specific restriction endonuclease McrA
MAFTPGEKKEWRSRPEVKAKISAYGKAYREKNKEKQRAKYKKRAAAFLARGLTVAGKPRKPPRAKTYSNREWRRQQRLDAIRSLGGACVHCGITDERVLQIDHIVPIGDRKNRPKSVAAEMAKAKDLSNYQLLCANCHVIKTRENGEYLASASKNGQDVRTDQLSFSFLPDH